MCYSGKTVEKLLKPPRHFPLLGTPHATRNGLIVFPKERYCLGGCPFPGTWADIMISNFFCVSTSLSNVAQYRGLKSVYRQYRRKISQAPWELPLLGKPQALGKDSLPIERYCLWGWPPGAQADFIYIYCIDICAFYVLVNRQRSVNILELWGLSKQRSQTI